MTGNYSEDILTWLLFTLNIFGVHTTDVYKYHTSASNLYLFTSKCKTWRDNSIKAALFDNYVGLQHKCLKNTRIEVTKWQGTIQL